MIKFQKNNNNKLKNEILKKIKKEIKTFKNEKIKK